MGRVNRGKETRKELVFPVRSKSRTLSPTFQIRSKKKANGIWYGNSFDVFLIRGFFLGGIVFSDEGFVMGGYYPIALYTFISRK